MIRRAIPLFHVSNAVAAVEFYCHGLGIRLEFEHRPRRHHGSVLPGHFA